MGRLIAFSLAATLVGGAGCVRGHPETRSVASTMPDTVAPPTIEVRDFPESPIVYVVGWSGDDPGYGLRTIVRKDGTSPLNHALYLTSYYTAAVPAFTRVYTPDRRLLLAGRGRDVHPCASSGPCSPYDFYSVAIRDTYLRSTRDSIPVTFYDRSSRELTITLPRTLIDAYIATVDSVVASLRTKK